MGSEYFAEGAGFLGTQSPEPQPTNMRHYTELKDLIAPASSMSFKKNDLDKEGTESPCLNPEFSHFHMLKGFSPFRSQQRKRKAFLKFISGKLNFVIYYFLTEWFLSTYF